MAEEEIVQTNTGWRKSWSITRNLVAKDFKLKYRRSVLGVLWSVLNPLLTMIVLTLIFSNIFRFKIENYPVYLILGNTLFSLFTSSTNDGMRSIISSNSLIKKIRVEKLVFPTEKVMFGIVNYLTSLIAVCLVMVFFKLPFSPTMFLLPVILLIVSVFTLGVTYLISALAVYFRDMLHLWGVVTTMWMYLTPLFWPVEAVISDDPGAKELFLMKVLDFNPMYHYVTYLRDIMMYQTWPTAMETLICVGFAVITLLIGLTVFRKLEKRFILFI